MRYPHCTDEKSKGRGYRDLAQGHAARECWGRIQTAESMLSITSTSPRSVPSFLLMRSGRHQTGSSVSEATVAQAEHPLQKQAPCLKEGLWPGRLCCLCLDSGTSGQGRPPDNPQLDSRRLQADASFVTRPTQWLW